MGKGQKIPVINVSGQKVEIIKDLMKNDKKALIYLDPPYYPISKRKDGKISPYRIYNYEFLPVDFLKLKLHCDELTAAGLPFILTNSDCDFIKILFKDYIFVDVNESRVMKHGKGKGSRPSEKCLIITNFKQKEDFMNGISQITEVIKE